MGKKAQSVQETGAAEAAQEQEPLFGFFLSPSHNESGGINVGEIVGPENSGGYTPIQYFSVLDKAEKTGEKRIVATRPKSQAEAIFATLKKAGTENYEKVNAAHAEFQQEHKVSAQKLLAARKEAKEAFYDALFTALPEFKEQAAQKDEASGGEDGGEDEDE